MRQLASVRFPVPFYLRLPLQVFLGWEAAAGTCGILNFRRLGGVSFSSGWAPTESPVPFSPEDLIDSFEPPPHEMPDEHRCVVASNPDGIKVPSLTISAGKKTSFAEMRAYSEVIVFVFVESPVAALEPVIDRAFAAFNHFVDLYRVITQDPYVFRLESQLDTFIVGVSTANLPAGFINLSEVDVLGRLGEVSFPNAYRFQHRVDAIQDLFPGPVLESSLISLLAEWAPISYELPLHYELIFKAQSELKQRHYAAAVLEAESAVEVYVAQTLLALAEGNGADRTTFLSQMEDPRQLQLLSKRLARLDIEIRQHQTGQMPAPTPFLGSVEHSEWKDKLYKLRNRVAHAGLRAVSFDEARTAIAAGKKVIRVIEDRVPFLANHIQIHPGTEHLQNTAGRVRWQ